ncbi:MAG: glycosyltransferase [Candidatus Sericytochromatia bacterium]|nr:glycosyltransferase [Candidatus Sericytochromatia bacterium]
MRIAFFIGSIDISGGTYVILQHALAAVAEGHSVTLVALLPYTPAMRDWHPALRQLPLFPLAALAETQFDLAIATWWKTALELHRIPAKRYAYFVQSIESRFYPPEERPLRRLVEATYDWGLPGITEASWIQAHLARQHNQPLALAPNGVRKDLYRPEGPSAAPRLPPGRLRVLVEGPFGVPFKNVGRTLALMRQARVAETWLLTASDLPAFPGVARLFSRVPIAAVAPIYRACDVLVKLSLVEGMFGPPLEMFHCGGTAVVYQVTGHEEYIVPEHNALVLPCHDEAGVVAAVRRLQEDPALLGRLQQGALETAARWPDWPEASQTFWQGLFSRLAHQPSPDRAALTEWSDQAWQAYAEAERERLAAAPGLRLRQALQQRLDRLPRAWSLPLRMGKYLWSAR